MKKARWAAMAAVVVALGSSNESILSFQAVRPPGARTDQPTGRVRGRAISSDSSRPLHGAYVRAVLKGHHRPVRTAVTAADGTYELRELPLGEYTFTAVKPGFVPASFGQKRPGDMAQVVGMTEPRVISGVDFTLLRGGVVAGVVLDESNEPALDATVTALRLEFRDGRRQLVEIGASRTTNDIGEFRLFGLEPGRYYLAAAYRARGEAVDGELGYLRTYYPGTADPAEAQPVTVGASEVYAGAVIQLVPSRLATITGTAVDRFGKPLSFVNLLRRTGAMHGVGSSPVRADGHFSISRVPPGQYLLRGDAFRGTPPEIAVASVTVNDADVSGVRLESIRWAHASGRVVLRTAIDMGSRLSGVRIGPVSVSADDPLYDLDRTVPIDEDAAFECHVPPGTAFFVPKRLPDGLALRSVRIDGKDVTDTGFRFEPGARVANIEVELAQAGMVHGIVRTEDRMAVRAFTVIVFTSDRDKWTWHSRYLTAVRSAPDGTYRVPGLPGGHYYAAAFDFVVGDEWRDPDFLDRLKSRATSLVLSEGETKQLDLRLQHWRGLDGF